MNAGVDDEPAGAERQRLEIAQASNWKLIIDTKLIGNLSTRLSFDVKHETDPPDDKVKTDTVTRASLVYKF